jgi:hypothetical protein
MTGFGYDALSRLKSVVTTRPAPPPAEPGEAWYLRDVVYTFGHGTQIDAIDDAATGRGKVYGYDDAGRLTSAQYTSSPGYPYFGFTYEAHDFGYEYDDAGDIRHIWRGSADTPVTWWPQTGRPETFDGQRVVTGGNGAIWSVGTTPWFGYNQRGQVTVAANGCDYWGVQYSPTGLRAQYHENGATHVELDSGAVLVDTTEDGTLRRVYVFEPDGFAPLMAVEFAEDGEPIHY